MHTLRCVQQEGRILDEHLLHADVLYGSLWSFGILGLESVAFF